MKNHKPKQTKLPLSEFQKVWETKGVFSEHYIKSRLNKSSVWPKEEEARPVWEFCRKLWNKNFLKLARANESVTRQEFLDKMLDKLGFAFLPNTPLPITERGKEPDYIVFADEATKDSVIGKSKMKQYQNAITLVEAKKVHHSLSKVSERETPGRFPHQQVRDYLQEAADESGKAFFNWAVLTNGGKWRLYCRDAHPSAYFEFNLEDSINSFKDFMLFFALFRRDAFTPDSEGLCPLDYLRKEALQYQAELEVDLRKRVFNILVSLANGFYQRPENKIENLDELYENCLIFLYRLLFVLYAEGRGLLPVRPHGAGSNKHYIERYSLQRLIPRLKNRPDYFSEELTNLYEELIGLFHLINGDNLPRNKACNVPRYNGGLFNPKEYPRIDEWRVGEKTLADVLTGLMFTPVPAGRGEQKKFHFGETIDYADLEVRQLGSIYEGLLENHLDLENNRLVLRSDTTKRKETGTYYTPDYIVSYIVENTVKPLCDRINAVPKVKKALKNKIKDNSFAREMLKLKILDPAMGSGHFLVRATEFLADEIVNHPTTEIQTESVSKTPRKEIISMDMVPVSKGLSHEEAETAYWRRRIVESCIYGVDLNPLAVELAKLSLWLTCIATDQPLSFLDHHLRPGNSLIGAKLAELGTHPRKKAIKQVSIPFGPDLPEAVSKAISTLKEITEIESKDVPTIKDKGSRWQKEVWARLKPYRTIADLWTSTFFENKIDGPTYQTLTKLLIKNLVPRTKEARKLQKKIKPFVSSLDNARGRYFFHWELEFPEVFFNEDGTPKETPGFDAVIGNPPYGAKIDINEKNFISIRFESTTSDSAAYFLELSQKLSHKFFGMIVPKSIAFYTGWKSIRKLLLEKSIVYNLLDVGIAFRDVNYEQLVLILSNKHRKNLKTSIYQAIPLKRSKTEKHIIWDGDVDVDLMKISNAVIFRGISNDEKQVIRKIREVSIPFNKIFKEVYRGLYIPDSEKKCLPKGKYKFINRVPDVQRYFIEKIWEIDINHQKDWVEKAQKILVPRLFLKVLRGKRLIAFYDKKGDLLTTEKLVNITLSPDFGYRYGFVLALINSPIISFYLQKVLFSRTTETSRVMDEPYVSIFPIRRISFITIEPERERLMEELRTMVETGKYEDALGIIEECLPKDRKGNFVTEKERSDVVHDLLAFLAEEMIEMNKEKQKFVIEFLEWLEREVTKGSVDSLKNKTKIKEFYNYDFDTFIDVLKQNRILPKVVEFGNEQYEKLKEAYDTTMTKLHPLISKINNTGNLIDQIVYKLYGLTEKEIKIVEGSSVT